MSHFAFLSLRKLLKTDAPRLFKKLAVKYLEKLSNITVKFILKLQSPSKKLCQTEATILII